MNLTLTTFVVQLNVTGGYFHGRDHLTYGVDLEKIRFMGVLQVLQLIYLLLLFFNTNNCSWTLHNLVSLIYSCH